MDNRKQVHKNIKIGLQGCGIKKMLSFPDVNIQKDIRQDVKVKTLQEKTGKIEEKVVQTCCT